MNAGSIGQSIINGTYDLESKPLTAYEELKAWCEKYLTEEQWYSHPTVLGQSRLTIVDGHTDFFFNADGSLDWIDS